jgi:hypothetical protein
MEILKKGEKGPARLFLSVFCMKRCTVNIKLDLLRL